MKNEKKKIRFKLKVGAYQSRIIHMGKILPIMTEMKSGVRQIINVWHIIFTKWFLWYHIFTKISLIHKIVKIHPNFTWFFFHRIVILRYQVGLGAYIIEKKNDRPTAFSQTSRPMNFMQRHAQNPLFLLPVDKTRTTVRLFLILKNLNLISNSSSVVL